jgi:hypothetical protein
MFQQLPCQRLRQKKLGGTFVFSTGIQKSDRGGGYQLAVTQADARI